MIDLHGLSQKVLLLCFYRKDERKIFKLGKFIKSRETSSSKRHSQTKTLTRNNRELYHVLTLKQKSIKYIKDNCINNNLQHSTAQYRYFTILNSQFLTVLSTLGKSCHSQGEMKMFDKYLTSSREWKVNICINLLNQYIYMQSGGVFLLHSQWLNCSTSAHKGLTMNKHIGNKARF